MSQIKTIGFISVCYLLCIACTQSKKLESNLLAYIPNNTEIIIQINSSEGLSSALKNNSLINAVEEYTAIKNLKSQISPFSNMTDDESLIALSKDHEARLEVSFITRLSKETPSLDSIKNIIIEPLNGNTAINTIKYNELNFYSIIFDDVLFVSNTLDLTAKARANKPINNEVSNLFKTSSRNNMASVLFHHKTNFSKPLLFNDSTFNAQKLSKYTLVDIDISQHKILANGIATANDSSASFINIFKNTVPQENKLPHVLPKSITSFTSITFDDFDVFTNNFLAHNGIDVRDKTAIHFENIIEIGQANTSSQQALIIRSIDAANTLSKINYKATSNIYRGKTIYTLEKPPSFFIDCTAILNSKYGNYFVTIADYIVFSNDIEFLKSIITNHNNKTTLENSASYSAIKLELSDASSLLVYGNHITLNELINRNFNERLDIDISAYKSSAIQYVYDSNFAHIAVVLQPYKTETKSNTVSEEFNTILDAELLTSPQFVKNYKNNQMDIIVQDINNNVYLISNKGKVFWKKQLDGEIMGQVHQIDTYKNGRLQFVFNTANRLYVLDRNGKDVSQFPLKFSDKITQPVSVFDYDKNKTYRILITQGKSLLMYDKNGKRVTGFNYKSNSKNISSQPKHFSINNKDYIVFKRRNAIAILNRKGQQRIQVKNALNLSENDIYLYNDQFITTSVNGELLRVNAKGKITSKNLNLSSSHNITTTSKTLVSLHENKLTIRSKTIELDFGEYTEPKIFYINDKIYVTVTDLQSKKAYLFDSQAKPIANFPVFANSLIDMNNIDRDRALEVVTTDGEDSIIVYEIH